MTHSEQSVICPWCSKGRVSVVDGVLARHAQLFNPTVECPVGDMTPADAQERVDQNIAHHAATGE